jgi:hypothetical protein
MGTKSNTAAKKTTKMKKGNSALAKSRQLADVVEQLFFDLPDTPKEIAAVLKEQGVTGLPTHVGDCPIAEYIRAHVEGVDLIDVGFVAVTVGTTYGFVHQIATPCNVIEFMKAFDAKRYKFLIS